MPPVRPAVEARGEGQRDNHVWNPDTQLLGPSTVAKWKPSKEPFLRAVFVPVSEGGFLQLLLC